MKIVFLYDALALYGGIEKILIDKMNLLSMLPGYQIYIITTNQGEHPISFPLNDKVKHIDLNIRFHTIYQYSLFKRYYQLYKLNKIFKRRLTKCIENIQPDIITATTIHFTSQVINLRYKAKKIIECHSCKYDKISKASWQSKIIDFIKNFHAIKYVKKADAFVALTQESAQEWSMTHNATIIPNMINHINTKYDYQPQKRVIAVGRLEYQKGFDLLINSWCEVNKKHPDWSLHIFGDGSLKQTLKEQINKNKLSNVITIHEPTKNIYDEYAKSSIFVLSSRFEAFGLVLAEAMSQGLPCIAFDCPYGPRNIIKKNENGILVENLNTTSLYMQINYLIENEDKRRQLGEKAKKDIERFYPESIIRQWTDLYKKIIKQ